MPGWIPKFNPNQIGFKNNNTFLGSFPAMFEKAQTILEQFNIFDSDSKGQKGVIDASEANFAKGSIFFVEEGMTKEEFMKKNMIIWESVNPLMACSPAGYERPKLHDAVSSIVRDIINKGQFEEKKEMIMEKAAYLNEETLKLVKSKLSPEEQEKVQTAWDRFNKTSILQENELDAEAEKETAKNIDEAKREMILDRAKENGIELSEEQIQNLSNEDLNKLVELKIKKREVDDMLKDNAKDMFRLNFGE